MLPLSLVLMFSGAGADTLGRVGEFVRAEMARERVPGVALAIVDHGEVVKAEGYGYANLEHGVPVRPDTVFQSGSLWSSRPRPPDGRAGRVRRA
jgi:CubicO group peptidase (beta-lactamase class C family)